LSPEIISGRAAELDALAVRSQQTVATTNVYALRFFKKKGYQSYTFREPGAEEVANDTEITEPQPVDWYRWLTPDQIIALLAERERRARDNAASHRITIE